MNFTSISKRLPFGLRQNCEAWKKNTTRRVPNKNRHRYCHRHVTIDVVGGRHCSQLVIFGPSPEGGVQDPCANRKYFSTYPNDQSSRGTQQRPRRRNRKDDGKSQVKFRNTNMEQSNRRAKEVEYLGRQTRELLKQARQWNNKGESRMSQGLKHRLLNTIKKWSKLWRHKNLFGLPQHIKDDIYEGARASHALLNELFEEESRFAASGAVDASDTLHTEARTVCNLIITGWRKSMNVEAGKRALSIVSQMEYLHEQGLSRYAPDERTYNTTLSALCATINAVKSERNTPHYGAEIVPLMEDLVEKMEHNYATKKNVLAKPSSITYNILLTGCARSGDLEHPGKRADIHFQKMKKLNLRQNQFTYGPLLQAWTQRNNLKDMERAEGILQDMEAEAEQHGDPSMRPNNVLLKELMLAYCRICDENRGRGEESAIAVKRALSVFEWMVSSYLGGFEEAKPERYVINRLIQSMIKCRHKTNEIGAIKEAEDFLSRIETLYRDGTGIEPDVYTYTTITSTWARSKAKDAAFRAEMILNRMQKLYSEGANNARPNTATYNTVISAFARHGTAASARKAEGLLQRMDELVKEGNEDVRPDKISFSSAMTAYMNSGLHDISHRVEELHMEMERRYLEEGQEPCRPDTISFSTVLSSLGKSSDADAPLRAEAVVKRMEKMGYKEAAPTLWSYNHVLQCWIHSRLPDAMQKAEETVQIIQEKFGRLDHFSYSHLLQGWSMRFSEPEAAEKANKILESFIGMYIADKHSVDQRSVQETTLFNIVIMLYSRSGNVEGAMTVLQRMNELSRIENRDFPSPSIDTYNSVLIALSRAEIPYSDSARKERILELTLSLVHEIHLNENLALDGNTYGELLRICTNFIDDDEVRDHSLEDLFHRCCEMGYLNAPLIHQFQRSFTADMYERLLGPFTSAKFGDSIDWGLIPYEWKRSSNQTSKFLKSMNEKWLPNASRGYPQLSKNDGV